MGVEDEHLSAARLWAVTRAPYLATALFALSPIPLPGLGTLGTDRYWRLYIDPTVAAQWSVDELGSVLIHEVHHLLRAHPDRAKALGITVENFRRFNVAADCEINDDLSELALPAGGVDPAMFGFPSGELAETYFILLESVGEREGPECGSGAHGSTRPWELATADERSVGEVEADLIRQQTAVEIRASVQAGGQVPKGLERWAGAYLNPVVDWRRELAAQVRSGIDVIAGSVDYSYRRPSRRAGTPIGRAVILPALVQPVPRAAVVVDTSGSMSEPALERALAEIKGILQSNAGRARLSVLACDTAVRQTQHVFSASKVTLAGGGGTDMGAGIEAALALRPPPELVVVITDGFTP
jgi:predicted metal-dependent peptidase